MGYKIIFHIDLDAFFASVEQVLDPSLDGLAVMVKGPGEHRTVVAAASYQARLYGVRAGMPIVRARRLCPHGRFVVGRAGVYADFSAKVFAICKTYTPLVEPASIDEGYLDMTGTDRLYGARVSSYWPMWAAERLKQSIRQQTRLTCSVGIAVNKPMAKIASRYAKPNGIAYIRPGYERTFITPMAVDVLPGIGTQSLKCLRQFAVKTVADLQRLPVNLLKGLFGVVGEDFYSLAMGYGSDTICEPEDPKSISRGTTFDKDTRDIRFVKKTMRELVADVSRQARALGMRGKRVTVRLRYADFTHVGRCRATDNFTNHDHELYSLACRLFDELYDFHLPVRWVSVELGALSACGVRQMELWDRDAFERNESIYHMIDAVRSRYGPDAIGFAG